MKQNRSLFHRFLKVHFLFIFFPLLVLILFTAIVPDSNEKEMNMLNMFYFTVLLFGFIIVAFVVSSWLFFLRLRKRLTRLQEVMSFSANNNSFPKSISVQTDCMDEIDQLRSSFNWMIQQLEYSRKREYEEELLHHRLIANLSHDLRTPLTILRGHITRLNKKSMSFEEQDSLAEMYNYKSRRSNG